MFFVVTSTCVRTVSKSSAKTKAEAADFVESYGYEVEGVYTQKEYKTRKGTAFFNWDFENVGDRVVTFGSLEDEQGKEILVDDYLGAGEIINGSSVTSARSYIKDWCKRTGYKFIDNTMPGTGRAYCTELLTMVSR